MLIDKNVKAEDVKEKMIKSLEMMDKNIILKILHNYNRQIQIIQNVKLDLDGSDFIIKKLPKVYISVTFFVTFLVFC